MIPRFKPLIIFKQLISENAIDIVQVDACRMGGLNEVLAVQLMASKQNLPVWPHAGGVGLCEYSQHLAMIEQCIFRHIFMPRKQKC